MGLQKQVEVQHYECADEIHLLIRWPTKQTRNNELLQIRISMAHDRFVAFNKNAVQLRIAL